MVAFFFRKLKVMLKIDFEETFAPTCLKTTMCALATYNNWHVHWLGIKIAFLNGYLHEEVYVLQPYGFV